MTKTNLDVIVHMTGIHWPQIVWLQQLSTQIIPLILGQSIYFKAICSQHNYCSSLMTQWQDINDDESVERNQAGKSHTS